MTARAGPVAAAAVLALGLAGCGAARPRVLRASVELEPGVTVSVHRVASTPPSGAVLLLHSAMGRTPGVLEHADALAERGFTVHALDLFGGRAAATPAEGRALRDAANRDVPRLARVIRLAYAELAPSGRRFVVGWSYGAAWAMAVAETLPDLAGVAAVYGESFSDEPARLGAIRCPVLLVGASEDDAPSPAALRGFAAARERLGLATAVRIVPGRHGFMEPRHPGYDASASASARREIEAFLARPAP